MNIKKKIHDLMTLAVRSDNEYETMHAAAAAILLCRRFKIDLFRCLHRETVASMRYREILVAINPERES